MLMMKTQMDNSLILALAVLVGAILSSYLSVLVASSSISPWILAKWAAVQWLPSFMFPSITQQWQQEAWDHWEHVYIQKLHVIDLVGDKTILEIPTVNVQSFPDPEALLQHLDATHGKQWRSKPLLFKQLWSLDDLHMPRRLSVAGLLQENLTIPYFQDARFYGALAPNDRAPVRDIVANITQKGMPHKIGTQFLVQTFPELIKEVAPTEIVTKLFGDRFQPQDVISGAFGLPFLPPLTTVPVFVARGKPKNDAINKPSKEAVYNQLDYDKPQDQAFTGLHCEPIGNLAVQLEGEKQWTLVSPEYSFLLKPSASPDGRSFFVSGHSTDAALAHVPRYYAITQVGDAVWVPTWTWHRVDYTTRSTSHGDGVSVAGSLFHLRPKQMLSHNPLFALLVVPSLIKEVIGINTQ
jgi:Cupin-like domain